MKTIIITFIDGTEERIKCFRVKVENDVLSVRTSHSSAFGETWRNFPLAHVREWTTE